MAASSGAVLATIGRCRRWTGQAASEIWIPKIAPTSPPQDLPPSSAAGTALHAPGNVASTIAAKTRDLCKAMIRYACRRIMPSRLEA
jgi:hypothetical protein